METTVEETSPMSDKRKNKKNKKKAQSVEVDDFVIPASAQETAAPVVSAEADQELALSENNDALTVKTSKKKQKKDKNKRNEEVCELKSINLKP